MHNMIQGKTLFEKPKKKKITWHGQQVTMPFDCSVYQDKTVKIANRFTGEETEYYWTVLTTINASRKIRRI